MRLQRARHGARAVRQFAIVRLIPSFMSNIVILKPRNRRFRISSLSGRVQFMPPAIANQLARDIAPLRAPYANGRNAKQSAGVGRPFRQCRARIDRTDQAFGRRNPCSRWRSSAASSFLHAYALSTRGLALMVLAGSTSPRSDADTADRSSKTSSRQAIGLI